MRASRAAEYEEGLCLSLARHAELLISPVSIGQARSPFDSILKTPSWSVCCCGTPKRVQLRALQNAMVSALAGTVGYAP